MLSESFIGGFVSSCGTFIEYKRSGHTYSGFQIKTPIDNASILEMMVSFLELKNHVYKYSRTSQSYALLIIRNREVIQHKLIPIFDAYLEGVKKQQYIEWKYNFYKNSSTWNYRNVTSESNPQNDKIVDKNPNKEKLQSG